MSLAESGNFQKRDEWLKQSIPLLLIGIAFVFLTTWYLTPIPKYDDYDAILRFLINYSRAGTWSEKISLLFAQHNEHRIVISRLFYVGIWKAFGSVDLRMIQWIGNIFWIILSLFLICKIKISSVRISAACILFCSRPVELMAFSMASMQQYPQICFSVLSIFFYFQATRHFKSIYWAVICLFLTCLSGGGWLALLPLVGFKFLKQQRKMLISDWVFLCSLVVCFFYYFILFPYVSVDSGGRAVLELSSLWKLIGFLLVYIGNTFENAILAFFLGAFFIYASIKMAKEELSFNSMLVFFALSRSGFGIKYALSSRYTIYSIILAVCILKSYEQWLVLHPKVFRVLCMVIAIFYIDSSIKGAKDLYGDSRGLLQGAVLHPVPEKAIEALKLSQDLGICKCRVDP